MSRSPASPPARATLSTEFDMFFREQRITHISKKLYAIRSLGQIFVGMRRHQFDKQSDLWGPFGQIAHLKRALTVSGGSASTYFLTFVAAFEISFVSGSLLLSFLVSAFSNSGQASEMFPKELYWAIGIVICHALLLVVCGIMEGLHGRGELHQAWVFGVTPPLLLFLLAGSIYRSQVMFDTSIAAAGLILLIVVLHVIIALLLFCQ